MLYSLLPVLLALNGVVTGQIITSDTYFYGESPPVYPTRKFLLVISL